MGPGSGPAWRSVGDLAGIGVAMALSIVIGLAAGYYLDRWLETGPWLTLSGLGFGIAAAFVSLFRAVRAAERRLDDSE